jgi:hypothetical protein
VSRRRAIVVLRRDRDYVRAARDRWDEENHVPTIEGALKLERAGRAGAEAAGGAVMMHDIVRTTNEIVYDWYGEKNSCIFSSAVLLDVLHALGYTQARPVRVEASAHEPGRGWVIVGCRQRGRTAAPGMWKGHMAIMHGNMLLDPTLDQIGGQLPFSGPYDESWLHAWYAVDETGQATDVWTKYPGEGVYAVRYVLIRDREGWRGAPDWRRKGMRRDIANLVLDALQTEVAA